MSKTVCIYHSDDLDGWMSAAIVKHWFKENNNGFIKDTENNFCDFIGFNHGQPIPDLSEYDKVIMCDISFPKEEMNVLLERLDHNFYWIDHHISAIKENFEKGDDYEYTKFIGLRRTDFAACELTWMYFFPDKPMPEIVRLLGRYDCFGHKGTDEEQKVLEFQYASRAKITNYKEAYNWLIQWTGIHTQSWIQTGRDLYTYLCTEAKQVYKNGFDLMLNETFIDDNPNGTSYTVERKFICINRKRYNLDAFNIDYIEDGYDGVASFYLMEPNKWYFSLYSTNKNIDCSIIAKQFGGGGHRGASGFTCDNETFLKIINN